MADKKTNSAKGKKKEDAEINVQEKQIEKINFDSNNGNELDSNIKNNKELKWVLGIGIAIVMFVLISVWVIEDSKKFDYGGFHFQETRFGKIKLYTTQVSVYSVGNDKYDFKVNFRYDPRKLENIPVNGDVRFARDVNYVSLNLSSGIDKCENSSIGLINLGYLMSNLGINMKTAFTDQESATTYKQEYADCSNKLSNKVFILTQSNETKIEQSTANPNCYILSFKNCEVMQVTERLSTHVLEKIGSEFSSQSK